jgi:hypothetical protein
MEMSRSGDEIDHGPKLVDEAQGLTECGRRLIC